MSKEYRDNLISRSRALSLEVVRLFSGVAARNIAVDVIGRQLMRSATSIGANIVEGQASPTRKDFTLFMRHALKSANETVYWFSILKESNLIDVGACARLEDETLQLARILGASLRTLRSKSA